MKKLFTIPFILSLLMAPGDIQSQNSVLSNGIWYKIGITENGVYKITYTFFEEMGINPATINPLNIRIYGNGGGMLPQLNATPRINDLAENAIWVNGEKDGVFNSGDYLLFYGMGPSRWYHDTADDRFHFQKNIYADTNYYFLTITNGKGKRINVQNSVSTPATDTVTSFDDYATHELDIYNLIKSGRDWYGELFDSVTTYDFNFDFPNLEIDSQIYLKTKVAARSSINSLVTVFANSQNVLEISVNKVSMKANDPFANTVVNSVNFSTSSSTIFIKLEYNKPTSYSKGWLDFMELNVRRQLKMYGDQMFFRDKKSVKQGNISEFIFGSPDFNITIWEITEPLNVKQQSTIYSNGLLYFRQLTDTLKEFIAFDMDSFPKPLFMGQIPNQNLHGFNPVDLIIISPGALVNEAQRLADFHTTKDGLSTLVVTPQQIYNEFSSGKQDVTAIRDFIKMNYDKTTLPEDKLKFLLLFGDGSYDYKNRIENNTNLVPSYQSRNSLAPIFSFVSDDYYGFLNDNEGEWKESLITTYEILDIGIGRIPVVTAPQAQDVVNKIIQYTDTSCLGEWRNNICFVGDDGVSNIFKSETNTLADNIMNNYYQYNVEKIYIDAFEQIMDSSRQRAPGANKKIKETLNKGALIINYTGYGGASALAHEGILEIEDIQAFQNKDNLPLLYLATADYCRFDNPSFTSGGEWFLMNPTGGAIGSMGPSRVTLVGENFNLNQQFYKNVFDTLNGKSLYLGDIFKNTKNSTWEMSQGFINSRNYILLGDPALNLAQPEYKVITTSLNGDSISIQPDTITAKSKITISGYIQDWSGNKRTDFDGRLIPIIFDKPTMDTTLGDYQTPPFLYKVQDHILFKGNVSVKKGEFNFSFVVPKDIDFNIGNGKISYYATNGVTDATGSFHNFMIGDSLKNISTDKMGPDIGLYMNNKQFVSGDITDQNPLMLTFLNDTSGINRVGKDSIHDIMAILDDTTIIALNDYYLTDLNSYQTGKIEYPFYNLSNGRHTLKIKVWDVLNNTSEKSIEFIVIYNFSAHELEKLIYPNPVRKFSTLHLVLLGNFPYDFILYDLCGRRVKIIKNITSQYTLFNLENLKPGLYVYTLINEDKSKFYKGKLIIQ